MMLWLISIYCVYLYSSMFCVKWNERNHFLCYDWYWSLNKQTTKLSETWQYSDFFFFTYCYFTIMISLQIPSQKIPLALHIRHAGRRCTNSKPLAPPRSPSIRSIQRFYSSTWKKVKAPSRTACVIAVLLFTSGFCLRDKMGFKVTFRLQLLRIPCIHAVRDILSRFSSSITWQQDQQYVQHQTASVPSRSTECRTYNVHSRDTQEREGNKWYWNHFAFLSAQQSITDALLDLCHGVSNTGYLTCQCAQSS